MWKQSKQHALAFTYTYSTKDYFLFMYTTLFPVASLQQLHKSIHSQWVAGDTMFAEAARSWFQGILLKR